MKIGIVADTHSFEIPKQLLDDLKKVDLIIHAGDFCSKEELNIFKKIKNVKAVYGNMDDAFIRNKFPAKDIFEIEGVTIGLFHGAGAPQHFLKRVQGEFVKDKVDVVIFGHSHQPFNKKIGKVLYFNPGSPNDVIHAPYFSYGILEVNSGKVNGKIVKVMSSNG